MNTPDPGNQGSAGQGWLGPESPPHSLPPVTAVHQEYSGCLVKSDFMFIILQGGAEQLQLAGG